MCSTRLYNNKTFNGVSRETAGRTILARGKFIIVSSLDAVKKKEKKNINNKYAIIFELGNIKDILNRDLSPPSDDINYIL